MSAIFGGHRPPLQPY